MSLLARVAQVATFDRLWKIGLVASLFWIGQGLREIGSIWINHSSNDPAVTAAQEQAEALKELAKQVERLADADRLLASTRIR